MKVIRNGSYQSTKDIGLIKSDKQVEMLFLGIHKIG